MKIILLEDIRTLGKKGDVVNVSDGYARNMLIPQNKGVPATPKNLNDLKLQKAHKAKVDAENLESAKELSEKIAEGSVTVSIKVGEEGKTFGSVSAKDIAAALKEQMGLDIDRKKLVIDGAIKTIGETDVKVKLHPKVNTTLKVKVVGKED